VTIFQVPLEGEYDRAGAASAEILAYNAAGTRPPLVVIRTWSTESGFYRALARALGPDQPILSLAPPDFPTLEAYPRSTDAWVDWLLPIFRRLDLRGDHLLGGWSFGGVVALELAERLARAGERVALVLMLDSRRPKARPETKPGAKVPVRLRRFARQLLEYSELETRSERLAYARARLDPFLGIRKRRERRARREERAERKGARAERRKANVAAGVEARPEGVTVTRWSGQQMTFLQRTVHVAYLKYRGHPTDIPIALFRTQESIERSGDDPALGWWPLARGRFSAETVAGTHWTIFEPAHLPGLAARIDGALHRAVVEKDLAPAAVDARSDGRP